MSAEIRFYHLERSALDSALYALLARILQRGHRAVVRLPDPGRVEALNRRLWELRPEDALPHGSAEDGHAEEQPVWLTAGEDRPNGADVAVLAEGARPPPLEDIAICCLIFDGADSQAVAQARADWKRFREARHALSYWQQDTDGRWQQRA